MRGAWSLLLCLCCGCPGGGSQAASPASCDSAAEHLVSVCDPVTGEDFRALCEAESVPLVTERGRACVAALPECDEPSLDACDVHFATIACSTDADCPAPFSCDTIEQACVRCATDADCAPGRGCLMDLCFDMDSTFYQAFRALADAGVNAQ